MKYKKNIYKGIISLVLAQGIVKILGFVYKIYLANKEGFGDVGNAIYNSGYQIYALLLTVSAIGVPNAIAKLVAEKKDISQIEVLKILKTSLIIFSIIGIICTILLIYFSDYIAKTLLNIPEAKYSIIALAPAIFNVCILSVYRGYYNGINKMEITAKSQSIEQLFKTVFTITLVEIFFVVSKANTVVMATVANLSTTIATLCGLIYLHKKNAKSMKNNKFQRGYVKKILKISIPISLSSILASLNKNIDSITVVRYLKKSLSELDAKAQYGILSGKIDVLSSAPVSFIVAIATTIIPKVASTKDNKKIAELANKYILLTIVLILPCSMLMIGFSDNILYFLFGNNNGKDLLIISAISLIFIALEQIIHAILQGIGKVFVPPIALIIGVCIKAILNIKLIGLSNFYIGGMRGACIATLICHSVACLISFTSMKKNLHININFFKFILKPLIASCIMLMSLYIAYFLLFGIIMKKIAIILAISIAIIVYFLSIISLKVISKDEILSIPFFEKLHKNKKNKEKRRILHNYGE